MSEDKDIRFRKQRFASLLTTCRLSGFMDHGKADAFKSDRCGFRQPEPEVVAVVVAVDAYKPAAALLELVQQFRRHPIARMKNHIGVGCRSPHLLGKPPCADRNMRV